MQSNKTGKTKTTDQKISGSNPLGRAFSVFPVLSARNCLLSRITTRRIQRGLSVSNILCDLFIGRLRSAQNPARNLVIISLRTPGAPLQSHPTDKNANVVKRSHVNIAEHTSRIDTINDHANTCDSSDKQTCERQFEMSENPRA
jgi:hypothetical protein